MGFSSKTNKGSSSGTKKKKLKRVDGAKLLLFSFAQDRRNGTKVIRLQAVHKRAVKEQFQDKSEFWQLDTAKKEFSCLVQHSTLCILVASWLPPRYAPSGRHVIGCVGLS